MFGSMAGGMPCTPSSGQLFQLRSSTSEKTMCGRDAYMPKSDILRAARALAARLARKESRRQTTGEYRAASLQYS